MIPTFPGRIVKGRLILDSPSRFQVHVARYEGKPVEVVVRQKKSQRSLNQNAAYWGIAVEILCEHTGYDRETMHDCLRQKFASRIDPNTGLTIVESTASMDTKRFCEYYEAIQRWAAEFLGVQIPSPNEVPFDGMI
jgi:hypothetical protein